MKNFAKLLVTASVLAVSSFAVVAPQSTSAASSTCDAHGIGNKTMTNSTDNTAYKINGNQATVTFDVSNCANGIDISIIAWKAPNGTTGKPYAEQTMFAHKTDHFNNGRHSMTITLPDCFFQVDTVTGTKLTGSTGEAWHYDSRQVAFMHGGTKSCAVKPVTPAKPIVTPVAPTPTTPTPTVVAATAPAELPHTGPEAMLGTFLGASGAGTIAHRFLTRKSRR
jgi:hypothetical protein